MSEKIDELQTVKSFVSQLLTGEELPGLKPFNTLTFTGNIEDKDDGRLKWPVVYIWKFSTKVSQFRFDVLIENFKSAFGTNSKGKAWEAIVSFSLYLHMFNWRYSSKNFMDWFPTSNREESFISLSFIPEKKKKVEEAISFMKERMKEIQEKEKEKGKKEYKNIVTMFIPQNEQFRTYDAFLAIKEEQNVKFKGFQMKAFSARGSSLSNAHPGIHDSILLDLGSGRPGALSKSWSYLSVEEKRNLLGYSLRDYLELEKKKDG
jgi:hypothetical protein